MSVKAATAEMMKAWALIREKYPTDHVANAERILKAAYFRLNTNANGIVLAENLVSMYSQIR